MSNKTRKRFLPVALVMAVGAIAVMALAIAMAGGSRDVQAHGNSPGNCDTETGRAIHDLVSPNDPCPTPPPSIDPTDPPMPSSDDSIDSSSTTGGAGVKLVLTIESPGDLVAGSSIELYLEDDFQVPSDIDPNDVYFVGTGTGRVYVVDEIEIDDDDHFGGDDDWAIQVFLPDRLPDNDGGYDNWPSRYSADLELIFTQSAGIKNPTEAGSHSVGYSVLGPGADANEGPSATLDDLATKAKISLSDEDAGRGKEITVTGTGFNNGTGAEVYVQVDAVAIWWAGLDCAAMAEYDPMERAADSSNPYCKPTLAELGEDELKVVHAAALNSADVCAQIINDGDSLGTASVGSDDKFVVTFTVHQDEFDAGPINYLCAVDSEAGAPRPASAVKVFDLEASVSIDPTSGNAGDEITVKPRDFVDAISKISLGPTMEWTAASGDTDDFDVEKDGSDYVFDLPGGLDERVQIAVTDGDQTKRIYLEVTPSSLALSQTEVAPNASVIISGSGFSEATGARVYVDEITIDGEPIVVSDAGTQVDDDRRFLKVTSSGSFTATVRIWSDADTNPALDDDEYTIKAVDSHGYEGKTTVTVLEPTVMVTPETASPRDFIVISGQNWPISTADDDHEVNISVDGRNRTANIDGSGRFRYEYQLRSTIAIGDEQDVVVTFDAAGGDIEEETTFNVEEAELGLDPTAAAPGQTITVSMEGMPPYTLVSEVRIDGVDRLGGRNINTNRDGDAVVADVLIPFLDPGFYPVEVIVGSETRVAQLEVLAEAMVTGVAAELPSAVSDLGDNLDAIFHFNNQSKEWTFYDPRSEFADLNTLTELHSGQPYWVLVKDSQEDVDWNGRLVNFTCAGGDCWNLEIW